MDKQKIIIHADPDVKELIPTFLENRRKDVEEIARLVSSENYERIRLLAHSMKGSGAGYGFDLITEIGAEMERAAKAMNASDIRAWLQKLSDYLGRVEVADD